MALATISHLAVWYLNPSIQLGYTILITILADNSSSINVAGNAIYNTQSNHIDVAYHFTRGPLIRKYFTISYVACNDNTADLMTKGLNSVGHHGHTQLLALSE